MPPVEVRGPMAGRSGWRRFLRAHAHRGEQVLGQTLRWALQAAVLPATGPTLSQGPDTPPSQSAAC